MTGACNLPAPASVVPLEPMPHGTDAAPTDDASEPLRRLLPAEEPALRAFVRSLRVPDPDVDDVVQEAFWRAWRSRRTWDGTRPAGAWLRKTALRTWLDLRRRRHREPTALPDELQDRRAEPAPLRHDLDAALARLGPTERDVLLRFHRDGQTLAEIAAERAMPLNTVKSHLHRARRRLAEGDR